MHTLPASDWTPVHLAGPRYVPPYPGAAEDELAWHLVKYLHDDAVLRADVEIETPGAAFFTLDFVVEVPAGAAVRRIAVEVADDRTEADHERRLRRDATLLSLGAVDTVYRLRAGDVDARTHDVLHLMSRWDPDAFSARGRVNLRTLAGREAGGVVLRPEQPSVVVPYAPADDASELWHAANGTPPYVHVRRLDRRFPDAWRAFAPPVLRLVEATPVRRAA
jgi:hypothetical protein